MMMEEIECGLMKKVGELKMGYDILDFITSERFIIGFCVGAMLVSFAGTSLKKLYSLKIQQLKEENEELYEKSEINRLALEHLCEHTLQKPEITNPNLSTLNYEEVEKMMKKYIKYGDEIYHE